MVTLTPAEPVDANFLGSIFLEVFTEAGQLCDGCRRVGNASEESLDISRILLILGRIFADVKGLMRLKEVGHIDGRAQAGGDDVRALLGLREISR